MIKQLKNKKPLVTVVMPVYNAGDFLVPAIESILNQTFQNFEFIIVDDASNDGSKAVIRSYTQKYPDKIKPIFLIKNRNCGGDACVNEGFKRSVGKFVARMDADDVAHPKRLEKQVAYLRKHPEIIVLGTQAYVINKEGAITGEKTEPTTDKEIRKAYFVFHPMINPSVIIRRSLLPSQRKLYTISYDANNDLLTFFGFLRLGKFANLSEKLLYYRIHGKNDSLINPKGRFLNTLRIRIYAVAKLGYTPTFKGVIMNIAQALAALILPAGLITKIYLLWRGIEKSKKEANLSLELKYAPVSS